MNRVPELARFGDTVGQIKNDQLHNGPGVGRVHRLSLEHWLVRYRVGQYQAGSEA